MADQSTSWVHIGSAELTAQIDPHGAQLSILRDAVGRDLLWNGEASVWAGRAPLLFPIVGALASGHYRLGAQTFALSRHGFARGKEFTEVSATADSAEFRLRADEGTLAVYPFHFELQVRFVVTGATLAVTTSILNHGADDMPASVGYHPGLLWPLPYGAPRESHFIEFGSEETASVRRIDRNGLLLAERYPTPVQGRRLMLDDALFQDDVLIFDEFKSREVTYGSAIGPKIRVGFPDAAYLGMWSKPGASFICIEPWHGITDAVGFSGDFTAKEGVFSVSPGGTFQTTMTLTIV